MMKVELANQAAPVEVARPLPDRTVLVVVLVPEPRVKAITVDPETVAAQAAVVVPGLPVAAGTPVDTAESGSTGTR